MSTTSTQRAAEIQVLLEGIPLPAERQQLIDYARRYDPVLGDELAALPDTRYARLDEVGQALAPTEPERPSPERLPRPESGKPPGGSDYIRSAPTSGAVRPSAPAANPPKSALEKQTKVQKRQKHVRAGVERQEAQKRAQEEAS